MTTRRRCAVLLVLAVSAAACSQGSAEELQARYGVPDDPSITLPPPDTADPDGDTTPPVPDGPGQPTPVTCPFDATGAGPVECGEVVVPSRGDARREVHLTYARFTTTAGPDEARADPVVYLHGGPGGDIVEFAPDVHHLIVQPFIEHRDVILYDQRGSGRSSPLPTCSEAYTLEDEFYEDDTPHASVSDRYVETISRCGRAIALNTDFDLGTYTSASHADDLVDLMTVLGYDTYNLYGSSYGSRLAQTVLRDHPEGVRTAIMSGVYPIEEQLIGSTPAAFRDALGTIFEACAADPACNEALPDPEGTLVDLVARLDVDPVLTQVPVDASSSYNHTIGGDDLINALHGALYRWDTAAMIPDLMIDLVDGDTSRLERLSRWSIADIAEVAPYVAVQCSEEAPFTTAEAVDAAHTGIDAIDRIDLPPGLLGTELLEICAAWDVEPLDPTENDAATWPHPTLLLSGGFDPITPPHWASDLAARLPDARLVHSIDLGHDSDESACAQMIMSAFVETPDTPISDCAGSATHAIVDINAVRWRSETVPSLQPATLDLGGAEPVQVERPDWLVNRDGPTHIWWRDLDALDYTAVVVAPGAPDVDGLLGFLEVEVDLAEVRPTDGPVPLDGWTRHAVSVPGMDLVIHHRAAEPQVTVALVGFDEELDALERQVVVPILRSIDDG